MNMIRGSMAVCLFSVLSVSGMCQEKLSDWKAVEGVLSEKVFKDEPAFHLSRGMAYLPHTSLTDGVVEVDIGGAQMAGLVFRVAPEGNYEEVYLRFFRSGSTDAIQYGPAYNGEFGWQFYGDYQAKTDMIANDWNHLKIVFQGLRAAVYVNGRPDAALVVDSLRIGGSGAVGFWSLSTGAYFKRFTYRTLLANESVPAVPSRMHPNPDAIQHWELGKSDNPITDPGTTLIPGFVRSFSWIKTVSEPDGFLNINRYVKKKAGGMGLQNSVDTTWLKYEWEEKNSGVRIFCFEFSNQVSIFVNGRKFFSGDNSFFLKGEFYRGDIDRKLRANQLFVPVKKGINQIILAVVSKGNGWGVIGQLKSL